MAQHAGVAEPAALQAFLQRSACHCTEENAEEWLNGTAVPGYDKKRDIIRAFHTALPDIEVWEEYRLFVKGEPFLQGRRARASFIDETLDQMLGQTGLPPGLQD
ncbi:MAG: hypothetical protein ACR2FO_02800 [Actinomycetota bacterium]